jgi:hypothetical protein
MVPHRKHRSSDAVRLLLVRNLLPSSGLESRYLSVGLHAAICTSVSTNLSVKIVKNFTMMWFKSLLLLLKTASLMQCLECGTYYIQFLN